jgi:hypothetical protein
MSKIWTYEPNEWPAKFGRKWLWTIFAESVHHQQVVDLCKEIGITDLCILCNDSPADQPDFGIRTGAKNVVKLSALARAEGIDVHLGTWLDPKEAYVLACAEGMAELARDAKAKSVCLDLEGEWRKRIKNHASFVAGVVAPAFQGFPVPIGVTSFANLPKEVVPALAWAVQYHRGYGQPQAYSVYQGKKWQHSASLQPDQLSSMAWRTWSPITHRLVCLQAAYGKPVPGRRISGGEWAGQAWGVSESIAVAAQRAEVDGFPSIGWWSQEALSRKSAAAKERRAVIGQIQASGRSLLGRAWGKTLAFGAGAVAVAGGVLMAVRRGKGR